METTEAPKILTLLKQFDAFAERVAALHEPAHYDFERRRDAAAWAWAMEMDDAERALYARLPQSYAIELLTPGPTFQEPCRFEPDDEGARSRRQLRAANLARLAATQSEAQEDLFKSRRPMLEGPWRAGPGAWSALAQRKAGDAGPALSILGCLGGGACHAIGMPHWSLLASAVALTGIACSFGGYWLARSPKAPTKRHALATLTRAYPDLAAEGFFDSLCDPKAYIKGDGPQTTALEGRASWSGASCVAALERWADDAQKESGPARAQRLISQGQSLPKNSPQPWASERLSALREEAALAQAVGEAPAPKSSRPRL